MATKFKPLTRREFIITVTMLAVFTTAIFVIRRSPAPDLQTEDRVAPQAQFAYRGTTQGERAVSPEVIESPQFQTTRPDEQRASGKTERSAVPVQINSAVMQAKLIHKVDPVYPEIAKSSGLFASVTLAVTADEKGAVSDIGLISGNQVFAEAAAEAVRQWRYAPAVVDGKPVPVSFSIYITFQPDEKTVRAAPAPWQLGPVNGADQVILVSDDPSDTAVRIDDRNITASSQTFNGREYYSITPDMSPPVIHVDKSRLREIVSAAALKYDERLRDLFGIQSHVIEIFINENGIVDATTLRPNAIEQFPGLQEELMNLRVQSPARLNGEAVPSRFTLTIDVPEIIQVVRER